MKKNIFLIIYFVLSASILAAQTLTSCEKYLQKIIQSSSHFQQRFADKNIFLNKKWNTDASLKDSIWNFTIYYENKDVGAYNRIAEYHLNLSTKKLSVEDTFSQNNSLNVSYNKKFLEHINCFTIKTKL